MKPRPFKDSSGVFEMHVQRIKTVLDLRFESNQFGRLAGT